jgi:flagellar biosynthetic protein FliR
MHSYNLSDFFAGHVFAFMLLLARLGTVMMLFPGIGEGYVPPRVRMAFAGFICLLLLEPMLPRLPPMPASPAELARLIGYEIIIGLFFGTLVRTLVSTLEAAGALIGLETGLSNATLLSPALATQSTLPSAFLTTAGLVLIFITGMDHFLIRSSIALYDLFPAGGPYMPGDMAQSVMHIADRSFTVGIELASPFLVMSLLFYVALGLLQRLMPMIQLFMLSMPVQIWGGLFMLSLTFSGMLVLWLHYFDQSIDAFFQG